MPAPRRLLTVGHSYAVALNRRLADEMARAGGGRWDVLAVGPKWVRGDLRPIAFEPPAPDGCPTEAVSVYFSRVPHVLVYGLRLREIIRGGRWDLLHCWQEPYVLAGGQVMWWAGKIPVVFSTYQNLSKRYPPPFNWVERYCVRKAVGWVTGAVTVRENLLARPGYAERPHVLAPLGVDTDAFRPDPAAGAATGTRLGWVADGPPVVGYLGRFIREKGVSLLMRVLDRVTIPWRALFVGGGPLEDELRAWATRYGDRVRVVTGVPHAGVPAHLNAMDVLAAPSQTTRRWKEQLGRMLIEGFAVGVPVIGSDSGEIPHVIADAGVVVPEADEAAWAAALTDLLESPAKRAELAARGLARARERFTWPVVARQHVEFFESVLGGKSA